MVTYLSKILLHVSKYCQGQVLPHFTLEVQRCNVCLVSVTRQPSRSYLPDVDPHLTWGGFHTTA